MTSSVDNIRAMLPELAKIDVRSLPPDQLAKLQATVTAASAILAEDLAKKAASDLTAWCRMNEFNPAAHHQLIIDHLEGLERGDFDRLMIMLPPGSAKSTYASVLFPPWYLGRHPRDTVIAASHTLELAERFGRKVRNIVQGEHFQRVFGFGLSKDSTAAGRWDTAPGGEYFAAGVGGSVTGRRADLLIIDDPVRSREDADSERVRDTAWEWYVNDAMTRLKPGGKQVMILTRWHELDLAGRALQRDGDKWKILKIPMEAGENDLLGRQPGERLWKEWFTDEMVATAKADPRGWQALYQQEPRPVGGGEFKRDWINYYSSVNPKDMTTMLLVDPASGKRKNNDYTSMWVVGLGRDDNYYVLDVIRDRLNLTERADTVFRLHQKYRPIQVRYEKYSMQADIEYLEQEMGRRSYRFRVTPVGGIAKKEDRVRRLIPFFEMGRMWFPSQLSYTDHTGRTLDLVHEFIETEYLSFPVSVHDDMIDSLSRLAEPGMDLPWPRKRDDPAPPEAFEWKVFDEVMGW